MTATVFLAIYATAIVAGLLALIYVALDAIARRHPHLATVLLASGGVAIITLAPGVLR